MRGRGTGAIVNLASVSGVVGNQGRTAYGASKGGVIVMTKVMALELAPLGDSRQCDRTRADRDANGETASFRASPRGMDRFGSAAALRNAGRCRERSNLFAGSAQVRLYDRPDNLRRWRLYCCADEEFRLVRPQPLGSDPRAVAERFELGPDDRRMDFF